MKQIKVSLDVADIKALEDICRETGRSLSTQIREAVKSMLREVKEHD